MAANQISHRLIGAVKGVNFGKFFQIGAFLEEMAARKMVFFGEIHGVEKVVALQVAIQNQMIQANFGSGESGEIQEKKV